jgi:hypothetical protein
MLGLGDFAHDPAAHQVPLDGVRPLPGRAASWKGRPLKFAKATPETPSAVPSFSLTRGTKQ